MTALQADPNALIRFSETTHRSLIGVDDAIGQYRRARNTFLSSRTDIAQPPLNDITDMVTGRVAELRKTNTRPAHVADRLLQADAVTGTAAPRATQNRLYLHSASAKRSVLFSGPLAEPSRLSLENDRERIGLKPPARLLRWMFPSPTRPPRPQELLELWHWLNGWQFSGPWLGGPWQLRGPWLGRPSQPGGPWLGRPWQPGGPWQRTPWPLRGPWQNWSPWNQTPRLPDIDLQDPWVVEQLMRIPGMLKRLQSRWGNFRLPTWLTGNSTVQTAGRFNALLGMLALPDNIDTLVHGSGHDNVWRDLLERYLAYIGINLAGLQLAAVVIGGKALAVPLLVAGGISSAIAAIRWGWDNPLRAAHFTLTGFDKPPQLAEAHGQMMAAAGTTLGAVATGTAAIADQAKERLKDHVDAAAGSTGPLGRNANFTAGALAGGIDLASGALSGGMDLAAGGFRAGGQVLTSVAGQARTGLRRTGLQLGVNIDRPAPAAKDPKKNRDKNRDDDVDFGKEPDRYSASANH